MFRRILGAAVVVGLSSVLGLGTSLAEEPREIDRAQLRRLVEQGGQHLGAGDLQSARATFEEARHLDPDEPAVWLGLAWVEEAEGRLGAALPAARRAHELAPEEVTAARTVAQLLARLGAVEASVEMFSKVRELDPADADALLAPALLLRDAGREREGADLLAAGVEAGLDAPDLYEQLTLLQLSLGEVAAALDTVGAGLERHSEHARLSFARGLALAADAERREEALPLLTAGLSQEGIPQARVHYELGSLLTDLGRPAEAIGHLDQAKSSRPQDPDVAYRLAQALRAAGHTDRAKAELDRYGELRRSVDGEESAARNRTSERNRAQQLATQNRLEEALAVTDQLLQTDGDDEQTWALQAKVQFSLHRRGDALVSVQRARALNPGQPEYQYLEGLFAYAVEDMTTAMAALERVLALQPDLAEAHELLGLAAEKAGEPARAIAAFDRALALGRDTEPLRTAYDRAQRAVGQTTADGGP